MTVKNFYNNIHGDYNTIFSLLASDKVILHFIKQFPSDNSFTELMEMIQKGDIKASFEAAHKLKGIAANLAFSELFAKVSTLTEQLRSQTEQANPTLVKMVSDSYYSVICEINKLANSEIGI